MTLVLRFLLLVALFSRTSALDGEYLYNGDPEADNLILEYQGNGQVGDFLASNKPRITEFYSPYCVSQCCVNPLWRHSLTRMSGSLSTVQALVPAISLDHHGRLSQH